MSKKIIMLAVSALVSTTAFSLNPFTLIRLGAGAVAVGIGGAAGQVGKPPVARPLPKVQLTNLAPTEGPKSTTANAQAGAVQDSQNLLVSAVDQTPVDMPVVPGGVSQAPVAGQTDLNMSVQGFIATTAQMVAQQQKVQQENEALVSSRTDFNGGSLSLASTSAYALLEKNQAALRTGVPVLHSNGVAAVLPPVKDFTTLTGLRLPEIEMTYAGHVRQALANHPYLAAGTVVAVAGVSYCIYKKINPFAAVARKWKRPW